MERKLSLPVLKHMTGSRALNLSNYPDVSTKTMLAMVLHMMETGTRVCLTKDRVTELYVYV
jgi:hypothetical protein